MVVFGFPWTLCSMSVHRVGQEDAPKCGRYISAAFIRLCLQGGSAGDLGKMHDS